MDRKSIIILVVSFGLIMAWLPLSNKIWPPKPAPPRTNTVTNVTNQMERGTNPPSMSAATNVPPNRASVLTISTNAPEVLLVVTNENARYTFTSHGGGLKQIELFHYPETVNCREQTSTTNLATLNTAAPLPVLALTGGEALQGDGVFKLERTPSGVRALKQLSNGLLLEKEFQLSSNYLVNVTGRIRNTSDQPIALPAQEWNVGTATPMGPLDNEQLLGIYWYNGTKDEQVAQSWFANRTLGCFPGTPRTNYVGGLTNVYWAAVNNQFFALALMPKEPAAHIVAYQIDLPPPSREVLAANPKAIAKPIGFQASVVYGATTLAANQILEKQFSLFAGPKENHTLERIATQLNNNIDSIMGYSGFFGWFAKVLLWAMNSIHSFLPNYGVDIIVITVIIKLLFWPLTQASTRSMKRMQALQPQMNAIKEKLKDDPSKMNKRLMEFMKENKVSPLGGCLPMVLQIPVFFGFYRMIQSAIELRGARFLWACDLSKPDTLFIIPGLNFPFNPLPLVMGVTMLWQARLTPPSPGMDPAQQKIMKYMPLMFLFILYNFSSGLTLYWTVQNLLTITQMKLTKSKDQTSPATSRPSGPTAPPKKKK